MNYSTLNDLIDYLEYGTKLHIGVLFFGNFGNEKLILPPEKTIHTSPICSEMKEQPNGYRRCFYCRNSAIKKALDTNKPFSGLCINGIYEYTRPVMIDNSVVCMIFVGNIMPEGAHAERLLRSIGEKQSLADTTEKSFSFERCERIGELVESYIRMILALCTEESEKKKFDPLIENLKSYIEANLEYKIDLGLLAQIFHYNEKYLGRLFKKRMNMSFSEYVNMRRVERGRELLLDGDDTVINISCKIGFNNVTYFNRVFKKYYGVTPSEYRQKR